MTGVDQLSILGDTTTPAAVWEKDSAKRALDELFTQTSQYKTSKSYGELVQFISRFRFYSPYNAMLVHVQMPGAKFVAPPSRWLYQYGRRIKAGAHPLVILQPMGPVMFVFDVNDTEPTDHPKPLPPEVEKPFEVRKGKIGGGFDRVIENAKRDGIRVINSHEGSQSAGSIRYVGKSAGSQRFRAGVDRDKEPVYVEVPIRYDLLVNGKLSREAQYATITHELAHLYCGHLGTPNLKWWPDRRGLNQNLREFEAESVTHLVCSRSNIDSPSEQYLSCYLNQEEMVPAISLECVMKAAGLIETMSQGKMKLRKQKNEFVVSKPQENFSPS